MRGWRRDPGDGTPGELSRRFALKLSHSRKMRQGFQGTCDQEGYPFSRLVLLLIQEEEQPVCVPM